MLTGLNIEKSRSQIAQRMISTTTELPGFEVITPLGPVEAVIEKGFRAASISGLGAIEGGGLSDMVFNAKQELAASAADIGANAVVGLRYELAGRELEKSLIAYGTAVIVEKKAKEINR